MLSKLHRLTKNKDFQKVFKKGRFIYSHQDFLRVKFLKNNLPNSRFGFVVSSKVSNKASKRNKIKRFLREVVRKKLDKIKPGFDIVIITQKAVVEKSLKDISSAIDLIFKEVK